MGVHFVKVPVTLVIAVSDETPDVEVLSSAGALFMGIMEACASILPLQSVDFRGSMAVAMTPEEYSIDVLEAMANTGVIH